MSNELSETVYTDPPSVRRANGNLVFVAAIAGFFVFIGGLTGFYMYASHGTEKGPGQTAQIQQTQQKPANGSAEPPRQNNPNPPGDRASP